MISLCPENKHNMLRYATHNSNGCLNKKMSSLAIYLINSHSTSFSFVTT